MEQKCFPFVVRKPLESHFYPTQVHVFVSECSAQENEALWNPVKQIVLFISL